MTRRFLLFAGIAFCTAVAGCAHKEMRLLGTWQSDREGTEQYLVSEAKVSPAILSKLDTVLGRMKITYTPSQAVLENCELAGTYRYEILSSAGNEVQVRLIGSDGEKGSTSK